MDYKIFNLKISALWGFFYIFKLGIVVPKAIPKNVRGIANSINTKIDLPIPISYKTFIKFTSIIIANIIIGNIESCSKD